jgi:hypothetical protein
MFECFERTLDHLPYGPDHCRQFVLRVTKTDAGRVLDERGLSARVIAEQSRHTPDNVAKREVFNDLFIGAKTGCEKSDDVKADLGMAPQEIE